VAIVVGLVVVAFLVVVVNDWAKRRNAEQKSAQRETENQRGNGEGEERPE
jgi:hypothetical protein